MPILCGVAEPSAAQLRKQLDGVTLRDAARIGRRLKNLRGAAPEKLRQLADQVAAAQAVIATRQAAVPAITYPDLPVSERRQEIAEAIWAHQVVVIAGETGVGKDHPAAQDLSRGRPRYPRNHRAYPAPPAGRPHRRPAHR